MALRQFSNLLESRLNRLLFPLALFADAIDLERVARGGIPVFAAYLLLEPLNFWREEFDGAAAFGADHVVMTTAVVLVLVPGDTVLELNRAGQSTLSQKLQRAIDGCKPDPGVALPHKAVQFIGGKMVTSFQKRAQDRVALFCMLQPDTPQVLMKNVFRFPDHLGRNRPFIDAFLEHGSWRSCPAL